MGKFDVDEAVSRVRVDPCEMVGLDGDLAKAFIVKLRSRLRAELRAAVLAGREEALAAVSQQHANGWTGERGDGWRMTVTHCEAKIRELLDP